MRSGCPQVPGFEWRDAGKSSETAGAIILAGRAGPVLILDFHNYVLPLDPDTLLIWHQQPDGPLTNTSPVVLRGFRLSGLRSLEGGLEELCRAMRHANAPVAASAAPEWEQPIPTTVLGPQRLVFPSALRHLRELLILCSSSAIAPSSSADRGNLALLIARPSDDAYELYPQDWFNNAGLDYSYQGVKRVARDPVTGRIHGEGVRIPPFVLDRSLRRTL
jgi:hypothetical protein